MIKIINWYDIVNAVNSGQISQTTANFLAEQFRGLHEHLGVGSSLFQFDLTESGPLWVTGIGDKNLGWTKIRREMRVQSPEFVERHVLADRSVVFRAGFMADNDYMPLLVASETSLDAETLAQLSEETFDDDREMYYGYGNRENPF